MDHFLITVVSNMDSRELIKDGYLVIIQGYFFLISPLKKKKKKSICCGYSLEAPF